MQCDEIQIARERRQARSHETNNITSDENVEKEHSIKTLNNLTEIPIMMNNEVPVQFKYII